MFRKFDEKESISAVSQLKTSVQKGIRNQVKSTLEIGLLYMRNAKRVYLISGGILISKYQRYVLDNRIISRV